MHSQVLQFQVLGSFDSAQAIHPKVSIHIVGPRTERNRITSVLIDAMDLRRKVWLLVLSEEENMTEWCKGDVVQK